MYIYLINYCYVAIGMSRDNPMMAFARLCKVVMHAPKHIQHGPKRKRKAISQPTLARELSEETPTTFRMESDNEAQPHIEVEVVPIHEECEDVGQGHTSGVGEGPSSGVAPEEGDG